MTFDRNDLNLIATAIDIATKAMGIQAAKQLIPLWDKTEQIAKEMDTPSGGLNEDKPSGVSNDPEN